MKVYTEVNYEFIDGSLVEQSSTFYHYEGEITKCGGSPQVKKAAQKVQEAKKYAEERTDAGSAYVDKQTASIQKGPQGGLVKHYADQAYGGSTAEAVSGIQRTYSDAEANVRDTSILDSYTAELEDGEGEEGDLFADDTTTEPTPEEKEQIEQQGLVQGGGRKKKEGATAMAQEGNISSSILAPMIS